MENSNVFLEKIFQHLHTWRNFPDYQLERRVDIFLSVYLQGVLEAFTGNKLLKQIIPEFPLKKPDSNRTVKVDYVLFSENKKAVYFVELKTDQSSLRGIQDKYLKDSKTKGFDQILKDLKVVMKASKLKQKYFCLLFQLKNLGFLEFPKEIEKNFYPDVKKGANKIITEIEVLLKPENTPKIEIIYILPESDDSKKCVDFKFIIKYLDGLGDPSSTILAKYLGYWKEAAGTKSPN